MLERFFKPNKPKPVKEIRPAIQTKTPREIAEAIRRIRKYPTKKLTQKEFDELPKNVSCEFLKTCPISTWFFCKPMLEAPDLHVVGQVVKGDDVLTKQFGAGLLSGTGEREINRYLVEIIPQ